MRLESWFITNPDESQQKVLNVSPGENLVVIGAAGSGKTNMAIYRANQAGNKPFVIIVYTVALKRMVSFGLKELGLDHTRVVHEWAWNGRGIDVPGDVFCLKGDNVYGLNRNVLVLLNETGPEFFIDHETYGSLVNGDEYMGYKLSKPDEQLSVSIDFDEWVPNMFYYTFYRRARWFNKIHLDGFEFDPHNPNSVFIASGFLFKQTGDIHYLIIDEGQDFSLNDYKNNFIPKAQEAITIFGDTSQMIYSNRGTMMLEIARSLNLKTLELSFNYRIPKTIALIAQKILDNGVDLISNNRKNGGNSAYPVYKKPIVKRCNSSDEELEYIIKTIQLQDLDDVAILLPRNDQIEKVHNYFQQKTINVQVRYSVDLDENIKAGIFPKFRVLNTLDFTNNDLPCLLTYHSAKGTEFDNVFIPFANDGEIKERNAFYVAVTRSNANLYISYSRRLTSFFRKVNPPDYEHIH